MIHPPQTLGPLLFSEGQAPDEDGHRLAVLLALPDGAAPPLLRPGEGPPVEGCAADRLCGLTFWRYAFTLPPGGGRYRLGAHAHDVAGLVGDMRIGFVSCNGKEHGDFDRPQDARDAMWARLAREHASTPLSLLIHGGDQLYADAGLEAHPALAAWADAPDPEKPARTAGPEAEAALARFFLDRWGRIVSGPAGQLMAQVPGLAMWDDHDIFDGYGSRPMTVQDSPVGRMVYAVARRFYRLFQAGGAGPVPPAPLGWARRYPGFSVVAPDLRTERRPDRVMSTGWDRLAEAVAATPAGDHLFLVSTVPVLGPRLSLVEGVHRLVPGAQKYEDDLRDQWQSPAHRAEWRRLLTLIGDRAEQAGPVTVLSGEIHLATRGEMRLKGGALHQLTASGISHPPPPRAFAAALGLLSRLGGAPLPDRPIRLLPLPGRRAVYAAQRNYLVLRRAGGAWQAEWELEESGRTPPLPL